MQCIHYGNTPGPLVYYVSHNISPAAISAASICARSRSMAGMSEQFWWPLKFSRSRDSSEVTYSRAFFNSIHHFRMPSGAGLF